MQERNVYKLFDEEFIKKYFLEKVLPLYPNFLKILNIEIIPHKKYIWEKSHHVVIEYRTKFLNQEGRAKILPIYCSSHSEESRYGVYESLRFLWDKSFNNGYLSIPHPLFFSEELQGVFYRGVAGENLYYYIKENNREEVKSITEKSARWFVKLHRIQEAKNFNPKNSRVQTVVPGVRHIIRRMKDDYPVFEAPVREIYDIINSKEKEFFSCSGKQWLVHGDAHPENVIRMSRRKIAVIDFTDLCLSDFARDIGSFTQQLDFMIMRKIGDQDFADQMKKLFIESYFLKSKDKLSDSVEERINTYYHWTAMRTAGFYLIKSKPEPERAYPLIEKVCKNFGIKYEN